MTRTIPSWLGYALAVLGVVLATLLRMALDPILGDHQPFVTYYVAVLLISWSCGKGPSLLAIGLSALAGDYSFIPPRTSLNISDVEQARGLVLFVLVALVILLLNELQRSARDQAEAHAREAASQREQLRVTLSSIGDAVIATDLRGCVSFLNPVAEALTGWSLSDAQGQPLEAVFRIVHEHSRQTVENPVARVLREGTVVGLANHTLLIAKDGTERPIADSAAPIREAGGQIGGVVLVFRDISAQYLAREERDRLAFLVESSNDAITGKTSEGIITSWNQGAEQLYGYKASEVVGRPIALLVPPGHPDDVKDLLKRIAEGEQIANFETVRRRKDGTLLTVSLSLSPIRNATGQILGASTIARDITAQKRSREALEQAKDAAETANRAKDQFLAMLSHELRTPLTPVLMAATAALQDPDVPQAIQPTFEMIRQNVELEARLIDDLLDVMRVVQGKMHYQWRIVDAHMLLGRVFDICRSDRNAKQIQVVTDLQAAAHHVLADPARLQQVFWNLFKNAVKFTPDGGTVAVRTRSRNGQFQVEVSDTGIGIEPDDLERIFRAFEQAEDPRIRKLGGLGLGLAISRSVAEAHGGELTASSAGPDQGATFTLVLPSAAPTAAEPSAPAPGTLRSAHPTRLPVAPGRGRRDDVAHHGTPAGKRRAYRDHRPLSRPGAQGRLPRDGPGRQRYRSARRQRTRPDAAAARPVRPLRHRLDRVRHRRRYGQEQRSRFCVPYHQTHRFLPTGGGHPTSGGFPVLRPRLPSLFSRRLDALSWIDVIMSC